MTISHACPRCGAALTLVRPRREPHYGLPLVFCPGCGTPWHRRPDPIVDAWHRLWRLVRSLAVLWLQLVALGVLTAIAVVLVGRVRWASRAIEVATQWTYSELCGAAAFLVLSGVWLTAGLSHWKRWQAFLAWGALIAAIDALSLWWRDDFGSSWRAAMPLPSLALDRLTLIAMLLLVAMAGVPVGLGVRRLYHARRSRWFGRQRQRLRLGT